MVATQLIKFSQEQEGIEATSAEEQITRGRLPGGGVRGLGLRMWTENTAFSCFLCASVQDHKLPDVESGFYVEFSS